MNLNEKQHIFAMNLAKLLQHVEVIGLTCSVGEVFRTQEQAELYANQGKGIVNSQHCKKLAVDLFLFSNGRFLQKKDDYKLLGEFWERLHPENEWGGSWKKQDLVHFQMK